MIGTDTINVTIGNTSGTPPIAPTVTSPVDYCLNGSGGTAAVLNASTNPGNTLLWYNSASSCNGVSSNAPIPDISSPGTFTYYVTANNGCSEGPRSQIDVIVHSLPTVDPSSLTINGASTNHFCGTTTNPVLLDATPSSTSYSIDWYTDSTTAAISSNSTTYTTPSPLTDTTSYYITQTEIISPILTCRAPFFYPVTIYVDSLPNPPSVNPGTRCGPGSVTLSNNPRNNESIEWYAADLPDPSGNIGTGNAYITGTLNDTTVFYAQAINTVTNCKSPIRTPDTAYIRTIPGLGADKDTSICNGDSINVALMIDTSNLGLTSAEWSINGNLIPAPYFVNETGEYQLEVNTPENCPDIAMLNLTVLPKVNAFAGNDTIAIIGGEHTLLGNGGVSYLWSPTTFLKNIADSNKKNPVVILNTDQLFVMTVANAIGCKEKDSVFVKVLPGPDYNTPNAFSPNGDGLNDIFRVVPSGIAYTEWFKIYNRGGELVFQTNKWLAGWDGTKNGKLQPDGTYVWIVKGMDKNGKVIIRKGTVMLIH